MVTVCRLRSSVGGLNILAALGRKKQNGHKYVIRRLRLFGEWWGISYDINQSQCSWFAIVMTDLDSHAGRFVLI